MCTVQPLGLHLLGLIQGSKAQRFMCLHQPLIVASMSKQRVNQSRILELAVMKFFLHTRRVGWVVAMLIVYVGSLLLKPIHVMRDLSL